MRSLLAAVAAVAAVLGGQAALVAGPASAGPVDTGWVSSGPGVTTVSDGSASAAQMTYNADGNGSGSWTFTTTATTASATGPIKVPYTWQGLHAWFEVTAGLEMIVDGNVVGTLESHGPVDCCTSPSNGFLYGGVATFDVNAGQTYGFRLSGSNQDFNNFLRGTFTLSTKPYIDATVGQDNRDWPGATNLADAPTDTRMLKEAGEARWFKFPVVPGQDVSVSMTGLPADYDVALYGDVGAAFDQLGSSSDVSQLAAGSAAGVSDTQVPSYPDQTATIPTSNQPSNQFAPRIYAPRIYAPRIYAPRIYAPRIYAPRIYAPRIYAPDSFVPDLASDSSFADAFSAAQNQTLLAVSANTGLDTETVSASTGNTDGFFYVRVQGHTDQTFNATTPFTLGLTTTGNAACTGLQTYPADATLPPVPAATKTVIVTDTNRLGLTPGTTAYTTYRQSLADLASSTGGAVIDVANSDQIRNLWLQVAGHRGCPYAVNLVADAVKTLVDRYRNSASRYVVIAGGDDVIPFFRYPDVSGLGEESQFSPPVLPDSPSGASLAEDQVQSQDAYGSDKTVTIGGATLPLPDLAVGRLVKSPDEIESTVTNYLDLDGGTLPAPTSTLVTGYDFLADAADAVNTQFTNAVTGSGTHHDTLIAEPGTPAGQLWTGADLGQALLGSHHDLVFLAGHFSANDTLAADFQTTFDADELDPAYAPDPANPGVTNADKLKNTLVLSAGCHSGYNIVNTASTPFTNPYDWTERMAQQHAVLIGGTGYQYGDSDFLEYSERLYLDIAKRLHEGPASGPAAPIAVGSALALAKQDYLAGLTTLSGIDQKAMLEATLYGLPMTGFDAPGRTPLPESTSTVTPTAVTAGPGTTFGLATASLPVTTQNAARSRAVDAGPTLPTELTWLNGADGVSVQPGAPALPKQIEDVTVGGQVLRGVGFRSGDYTDTSGLLPLTGAPAIEGSTPNSTFESSTFFPQRLATPNYFGALGSSGRTSLILTPAQYRSDPTGDTNTQRSYSALGMRLFYSPASNQTFGQNQPTSAAPPGIGAVTGVVANGVVSFSATVTGDPSAGVQQVWVTWTGASGGDYGYGHWASVDLIQDPTDSTHWTGTLALPSGQSAAGMRFLVQAANGVGAVGLDTADGDGYRVVPAGADTATIALHAHAPTSDSPIGVTAAVTDAQGGGVAGRHVHAVVSRSGQVLFTYDGTTAADGSVDVQLPNGQAVPSGRIKVDAQLLTATGDVQATDSLTTLIGGLRMTTSPAYLTTRAGTAYPGGMPLKVTVTDARGGVAGIPVTFSLPTTGPRATFPVGGTAVVQTDADGNAVAPALTAGTVIGTFVATVSTADVGTATVPMAAQYFFSTFGSPVDDSGVTVRSATATTPVKTTALLANGARLDDATASSLVAAGRVQIRWRQVGSTGAWTARTNLTVYSTPDHFFQSDLNGSTLGWVKGKTYVVTIRILPAASDPKPAGEDVANGSFDLGSRSFTLQLK